MAKTPKLEVRDATDVPLREVSGLAVHGQQLLAVGDHDPVVFSAPLEPWPLRWHGTDLSSLGLPEGGTQFEAVQPAAAGTVLIVFALQSCRPAIRMGKTSGAMTPQAPWSSWRTASGSGPTW
jgi:hypothetical protein